MAPLEGADYLRKQYAAMANPAAANPAKDFCETTGSYNQVDLLNNEISYLKGVILDLKEEVLNLYRRLNQRG